MCFCCEDIEITQITFECGHIISEFHGGETNVDNLLPICSTCNNSMGTENFYVFKEKLKKFAKK
jgi:hypothetical protein